MTTSITSSKITTPEGLWVNRQPDELDYLRPNAFRFNIQSLPKVNYFCQSANIPSINLGYATQSTPLRDIPLPGEKVDFGDLIIKFMIQEDMANYIELFNWIISLGFPDNHAQFQTRINQQSFRNPSENTTARKSDLYEYSDATLLVLDSDNLPIARLNFMDCFPISLTGLDFDISSGNVQYFAAQAVFKYRSFTVESLA